MGARPISVAAGRQTGLAPGATPMLGRTPMIGFTPAHNAFTPAHNAFTPAHPGMGGATPLIPREPDEPVQRMAPAAGARRPGLSLPNLELVLGVLVQVGAKIGLVQEVDRAHNICRVQFGSRLEGDRLVVADEDESQWTSHSVLQLYPVERGNSVKILGGTHAGKNGRVTSIDSRSRTCVMQVLEPQGPPVVDIVDLDLVGRSCQVSQVFA